MYYIDGWQKVWNSRKDELAVAKNLDMEETYLKMRRINGGDITDEVSFFNYKKYHDGIISAARLRNWGGVFEVGCGCGAELYLFKHEGYVIGGLDYSQNMIDILRRIIKPSSMLECICDQAINLPTKVKYDFVLCNSVCHYFPSLEYAKIVFKKMLAKSKCSVGIFKIHDIERRDSFLDMRRKIDPNYDEKYKYLPKLFYSKQFFTDFADENNVDLNIMHIPLEGFWNDTFVFDCIMTKRQ